MPNVTSAPAAASADCAIDRVRERALVANQMIGGHHQQDASVPIRALARTSAPTATAGAVLRPNGSSR